jgi:hypothetical protein
MTEGASLLRGKRYIHGEPGSPVPATAAAPAMNRLQGASRIGIE